MVKIDLRNSANLCVDFPGTGEDEITFHRGELIVVIAKDEGFGDGWWTVISPSPSPCIFARFCALITFHSWREVGSCATNNSHAYVETNGCMKAIGNYPCQFIGFG